MLAASTVSFSSGGNGKVWSRSLSRKSLCFVFVRGGASVSIVYTHTDSGPLNP